MQFTAAVFSALALVATALPQDPYAVVVVEASHGGAGNGLRNSTVYMPINQEFTNQEVLHEVSTLYLLGAEGVDANTLTCTPFKTNKAAGDALPSFTTKNPDRLSTNTVVVGSVFCE
ncbi:hypothetical protein M426DRAFT_260873 [Hypoxylon sp. CI-4A]|nr:hypothetical protein M426DRAFT_260873 [Hypoxylon sp. CI-4A]